MPLYQELLNKQKRISVTGLGYVGLPLALALGKHFSVLGYDIDEARVEMMRQSKDPSKELPDSAFDNKDVEFTSNWEDLRSAHFHIVAVPTPVDEHKVPNLRPVLLASETLSRVLKAGDYVVYESTVYPGCTEEDCLPLLEQGAGLRLNRDFKLGYSPERIVPGEKVRTLEKITKIVSGSDGEALDQIAQVYGTVIEAGVYKAQSIKVAEAAKVIENTQRDLNISLMNELAIIFDRLDIDTQAVLEAAGTKWNFLRFYPGLVGGHCISVDPYYLLHKSKQIGYDPQVILSGRRVNDNMPNFIAKRLVQMLIQRGKNLSNCKVLVMGVTFKENVADIRNSKVADLVRELQSYSINVHLVDCHASPNEVAHEYNLTLMDVPSKNYDAVVVAVSHDEYRAMTLENLKAIMTDQPILMDIKAIYQRPAPDDELTYWRL